MTDLHAQVVSPSYVAAPRQHLTIPNRSLPVPLSILLFPRVPEIHPVTTTDPFNLEGSGQANDRHLRDICLIQVQQARF